MKIKLTKLITWEVISWSILIITTILVVAFLPWYQAEDILPFLFVALGILAAIWYIISRKLYLESQEKSRDIMQAHKEIRNRQKTIDLIFDNSADGILVLDNEQRIISFSPGMEKMTGFAKNDVLGRLAEQVLKFKAKKDSSLLSDIMFLPKDIKKKPYVRNTMLTKEGREIEIEASYALITSPGGEHKGLAIIRDITYESELMERDKEFIAITSHQMNTPLSIMRGYLSMLLNGKLGKLSKEQTSYLEEIYNSAKKLINITNNLLSISRIEQDKIKLEKSDINVADLLTRLKQNFTDLPEGVTLKIEKADANLIVYADEDKLLQALSNLVDNSIKYTKKGEIVISCKKEASDVIFCISDTGIGIPPEDISKIGQKFYRSQNAITLDNKGTGLGMFIVRTIVEKHGGTLDLQSTLNKGTTVKLLIPNK